MRRNKSVILTAILLFVLAFSFIGCDMETFKDNVRQTVAQGPDSAPIQVIETAADLGAATLGWVPGATAICSLFGLGIQTWRKFKSDKKYMAGYSGANNILHEIKKIRDKINSDGQISVSDGQYLYELLDTEKFKALLQNAQGVYGVAEDVMKELQALRNSGKLSKVN